jgi:L-methionine (R)-S-oxide reductase
MEVALFCGLEGAPTFLVPIINPPFADNSPHLPPGSIEMQDKEKLIARYERIYSQLETLLRNTGNPISRMATAVALLHHKMPHFFWTGFYILENGELIVGPYQGPLACQVLEKNTGVCWSGILRHSTIMVPDVHKFPGHIACDSRSNSEIVVPLFDGDDKPWAVLDVDSRKRDAFSKIDEQWLEKIAKLVQPAEKTYSKQ